MSKRKTRKSSKGLQSTHTLEQKTNLESQTVVAASSTNIATLEIADQMITAVNPEIEQYGNPSTPQVETAEPVPTSTPSNQIRVNNEWVIPNTPLLTKMGQLADRMEELHAEMQLTRDLTATTIASMIGNRIGKSTPVKNSYRNPALSSSNNSAKLIANIKEMRENKDGDNWSATRQTPKSLKISSFTSYTISNEEDINTGVLEVTYNSGSRAVKVPSLGTYPGIVEKINKLNQQYGYNDLMISAAIRKLSKNQPLEEPFKSNPEIAATLSHLTTLLFVVEVDRNCGSSITTNMFLDLVDKGICTFTQLPILLPMAMKGAVKASKTLDKLLFTPLVKGYKPYDTSDKAFKINHATVVEFVTRNKIIFEKWIILKGHDPKEAPYDVYVKHIMESMSAWYNFALRPFRVSEGDVVSPFTRDEDTAGVRIDSNVDLSILEDEVYIPVLHSDSVIEEGLPPIDAQPLELHEHFYQTIIWNVHDILAD